MPQVIIIGAGPAGINCAIYLAQAGIDVTVLNNNKSSLMNATIRNFYSYNAIKGIDLFNKGIEQAKALGAKIINDDVIDINITDSFNVVTLNKTYSSKYLVLALGRSDNIKEPFNKYLGQGVSVCALCDGPLYRSKDVYLTGDITTISYTKEELLRYTDKINIININDIIDLKGENSLESIVLRNGEIKANNLFLSLKPSPKTLYFKLGLLNNDGLVKVDNSYKTNIDRLYAIGDMSNKVKQVSTALSSGLKAAISIIEEIKHENN